MFIHPFYSEHNFASILNAKTSPIQDNYYYYKSSKLIANPRIFIRVNNHFMS